MDDLPQHRATLASVSERACRHIESSEERLADVASPVPCSPGDAANGKLLGRAASLHSDRHVILFLAANPRNSDVLQLTQECAEIQRELRMARNRDRFRFESRWAVSIDEVMRGLTELDPTVIHFSGHGCGAGGLALQDEHGNSQLVSARGLAMMVRAAAPSARLVVLNACCSVAQAEELTGSVDCVVGMHGAVGDDAARSFAVRFYGALGNGRSIGNAIAQGIAVLAARRLPDELIPRCLTRSEIDVDRITLL